MTKYKSLAEIQKEIEDEYFEIKNQKERKAFRSGLRSVLLKIQSNDHLKIQDITEILKELLGPFD